MYVSAPLVLSCVSVRPKRTHGARTSTVLPAHGVHGRVLDAAEGARADPCAHDDCSGERVVRAAASEDARAALDDLVDVEQRPSQYAPAPARRSA